MIPDNPGQRPVDVRHLGVALPLGDADEQMRATYP
jgi:hypothetical protein